MSSIPVLTGATVLLIAIAQLACYVPVRYASKISSTEALRAEWTPSPIGGTRRFIAGSNT